MNTIIIIIIIIIILTTWKAVPIKDSSESRGWHTQSVIQPNPKKKLDWVGPIDSSPSTQ